MKPLFRKRVALPAEHGAWTWWLGPLAIGVAAAPARSGDHLLLLFLCLAGFLLRHPVALLVRIAVGRKPPVDRAASLFWSFSYAVAAAGFLALLLLRGHGRLLWLIPPAAILFAYHLFLISRKSERGSLPVDILASATLALAAPAAYWTGGGTDIGRAAAIWFWIVLHSAAAIVHVFFLLGRRRRRREDDPDRWRDARGTLAANGGALALAAVAAAFAHAPLLLIPAFALTFADALHGVWRPPYGSRVSRIGFRLLGISVIFYVLLAFAWA